MAQKISVWEEHAFWLEILGDHAHFIRDYLSPAERRWVELANQYIQAFNHLKQKLQPINRDQPPSSPAMIEMAKEIQPVAEGYYKFEGYLQKLRILNQVNLNLTPTYLNGTLNENQEYLRLLMFYIHGKNAEELSLVDLLDLWLEDQLGHALLLINSLDPIEARLHNEAEKFLNVFRSLMLKNEVIKGYLRFIHAGFPGQRELAKESAEAVYGFSQLVERVVDLYKDDKVFNRVTLRFLQHHFPESCYFLRKLYNYTPDLFPEPNCQLTTYRI